MAATAQYAATPKSASIKVSVANANRNGTGSIIDLYTAGTNGGRLDDIYISAEATTTAGMIRFYLNDGIGGTYMLIQEVAVAAIVPSGFAKSFNSTLQNLAWVLAPGQKIGVSTNNAESFVIALLRGGDL